MKDETKSCFQSAAFYQGPTKRGNKNLLPPYSPVNQRPNHSDATKLTWLEPLCASVSLSWSNSRSQQPNRIEKRRKPDIVESTQPVRRQAEQSTAMHQGRPGKIVSRNGSAGKAFYNLFNSLELKSSDRIMMIGGWTSGFTRRLAKNLDDPKNLLVIDSRRGNSNGASRKAISAALGNYRFMVGNVIEIMDAQNEPFDIIIANRVLGKLPMAPLFAAAARRLRTGGKLVFATPREDYRSLPIALLYNLAAEDPYAVIRLFTLDYPENVARVEKELSATHLKPERLWEEKSTSTHDYPESVFDHLIGTEVGSVIFDSVVPQQRGRVKDRAIARLQRQRCTRDSYLIEENYICCVAVKP